MFLWLCQFIILCRFSWVVRDSHSLSSSAVKFGRMSKKQREKVEDEANMVKASRLNGWVVILICAAGICFLNNSKNRNLISVHWMIHHKIQGDTEFCIVSFTVHKAHCLQVQWGQHTQQEFPRWTAWKPSSQNNIGRLPLSLRKHAAEYQLDHKHLFPNEQPLIVIS